jgi:hypothetical protein
VTENNNLNILDSLLDTTPAVFEGESLLLAEIRNFEARKDIRSFSYLCDGLDPVAVRRTLLINPLADYFNRWPKFKVQTRKPQDIPTYNRELFNKYESIRNFCFHQVSIADRVVEDTDVDLIVLLLFDGLSFLDWIDVPGVESCFVYGPTITSVGFRNIINDPTIAERLFNLGFYRRFGYSHWSRENRLADIFFRGFDTGRQMKKVDEFSEIISDLNKVVSGGQTYIQILTNGLDSISHRHRGRPPVSAIADHLYRDIALQLLERISSIGATAIVYITADHGVLWKPEPTSHDQFISLNHPSSGSRRYRRGSIMTPHSKVITLQGSSFTLLEYPFVFTKPSSLEWGLHGGISFQESFVPFLKLEAHS